MTKRPTKREAMNAARAFIRYLDNGHPRAGQSDFLMRLGRLYEFPPETPKFDGKWSAPAIAAFIQEHAREIG
jgi:hypothetical protein